MDYEKYEKYILFDIQNFGNGAHIWSEIGLYLIVLKNL